MGIEIELCEKATKMPTSTGISQNTNESFQMRLVIPRGASKLPELLELYFRIYLIKADFFESFDFGFWQF